MKVRPHHTATQHHRPQTRCECWVLTCSGTGADEQAACMHQCVTGHGFVAWVSASRSQRMQPCRHDPPGYGRPWRRSSPSQSQPALLFQCGPPASLARRRDAVHLARRRKLQSSLITSFFDLFTLFNLLPSLRIYFCSPNEKGSNGEKISSANANASMHPLTVSASRCGFFSSSNCSHAYFLRAHAPRAPNTNTVAGSLAVGTTTNPLQHYDKLSRASWSFFHLFRRTSTR